MSVTMLSARAPCAQPTRRMMPARQQTLRVAQRTVAPVRRSRVVVRAANDGLDIEKVKETYTKVTQAIPPVVTAATVPVVGLSLLCKALTGSGLPGTLLGSIEGISYLVLIAGFGSFLPRASAIIQGRDFSTETILKELSNKAQYGELEDSFGSNATQRLNSLSKKINPNSPLGQQMKDIEKARAEKAKETPEERAMKEKLKKELAAKALGVGKAINDTDDKKVETEGEEKIYATPVMETLKDCMTTENYDTDVTSYSDKDLGGKLNLSSPEIEKGTPVNNPGDKWREQYKTE
uniref:Uncharacterized protein n=1 Tax=Tetraselmis chuii TaxID=63592 RepID=A0A7S1SSD4_9CHLO|mmetsp:Transcript_27166/g.48422  ORF Transcript_27166/g.48422 Transcript_27166/m.48422 type:complete len:293 (+) Transcript_27166:126-1004(+)